MANVRGLDRGERPALVVSECQNTMLDPEYARRGRLEGLAVQARERGLVAAVNRLAAGFRAHDLPVVHCTLEPRADGAGLGTRNALLGGLAKSFDPDPEEFGLAWRTHPAITVEPGDLRVARQHGVTPFGGTSLVPLLRNLSVDTVVLVGVSTNVALPGSTVEAVNAGFTVVLPEDATCGSSAETHEFMLREFFPLLSSVTEVDHVLAALG